MSRFTDFVNGVGVDTVPVQAGAAPAGSVTLTPHDYFLASRVDGQSSLKSLRSVSGMSEEEFCEAMVKVIASGMVEVPGVAAHSALEVYAAGLAEMSGSRAAVPPPAAPSPPTPEPDRRPAPPKRPVRPPPAAPSAGASGGAAPDPRRPPVAQRSREVFETGNRSAAPVVKTAAPRLGMDILPPEWPIPFNQFTFDPAVMATGDAFDDEQKEVILYFHYHLRKVTYYALLGVTEKASRSTIKLAYFRLSKTFHPDRWYRKDTGEFGEMIEDIFKWLNRAYGVLSSPKKRKGYDKLLQRGFIGEWEIDKFGLQSKGFGRPVVPPAHDVAANAPVSEEAKRSANMMAAKARRAEAAGDWNEACDLWERVLQAAPTPDLRIRLAECMLKANVTPQQITPHVVAAREAGADDKTVSLVEAEVARRSGKLDRAEACFRHVLEIEPNNPVARLGLERLGQGPDRKR